MSTLEYSNYPDPGDDSVHQFVSEVVVQHVEGLRQQGIYVPVRLDPLQFRAVHKAFPTAFIRTTCDADSDDDNKSHRAPSVSTHPICAIANAIVDDIFKGYRNKPGVFEIGAKYNSLVHSCHKMDGRDHARWLKQLLLYSASANLCNKGAENCHVGASVLLMNCIHDMSLATVEETLLAHGASYAVCALFLPTGLQEAGMPYIEELGYGIIAQGDKLIMYFSDDCLSYEHSKKEWLEWKYTTVYKGKRTNLILEIVTKVGPLAIVHVAATNLPAKLVRVIHEPLRNHVCLPDYSQVLGKLLLNVNSLYSEGTMLSRAQELLSNAEHVYIPEEVYNKAMNYAFNRDDAMYTRNSIAVYVSGITQRLTVGYHTINQGSNFTAQQHEVAVVAIMIHSSAARLRATKTIGKAHTELANKETKFLAKLINTLIITFPSLFSLHDFHQILTDKRSRVMHAVLRASGEHTRMVSQSAGGITKEVEGYSASKIVFHPPEGKCVVHSLSLALGKPVACIGQFRQLAYQEVKGRIHGDLTGLIETPADDPSHVYTSTNTDECCQHGIPYVPAEIIDDRCLAPSQSSCHNADQVICLQGGVDGNYNNHDKTKALVKETKIPAFSTEGRQLRNFLNKNIGKTYVNFCASPGNDAEAWKDIPVTHCICPAYGDPTRHAMSWITSAGTNEVKFCVNILCNKCVMAQDGDIGIFDFGQETVSRQQQCTMFLNAQSWAFKDPKRVSYVKIQKGHELAVEQDYYAASLRELLDRHHTVQIPKAQGEAWFRVTSHLDGEEVGKPGAARHILGLFSSSKKPARTFVNKGTYGQTSVAHDKGYWEGQHCIIQNSIYETVITIKDAPTGDLLGNPSTPNASPPIGPAKSLFLNGDGSILNPTCPPPPQFRDTPDDDSSAITELLSATIQSGKLAPSSTPSAPDPVVPPQSPTTPLVCAPTGPIVASPDGASNAIPLPPPPCGAVQSASPALELVMDILAEDPANPDRALLKNIYDNISGSQSGPAIEVPDPHPDPPSDDEDDDLYPLMGDLLGSMDSQLSSDTTCSQDGVEVGASAAPLAVTRSPTPPRPRVDMKAVRQSANTDTRGVKVSGKSFNNAVCAAYDTNSAGDIENEYQPTTMELLDICTTNPGAWEVLEDLGLTEHFDPGKEIIDGPSTYPGKIYRYEGRYIKGIPDPMPEFKGIDVDIKVHSKTSTLVETKEYFGLGDIKFVDSHKAARDVLQKGIPQAGTVHVIAGAPGSSKSRDIMEQLHDRKQDVAVVCPFRELKEDWIKAGYKRAFTPSKFPPKNQEADIIVVEECFMLPIGYILWCTTKAETVICIGDPEQNRGGHVDRMPKFTNLWDVMSTEERKNYKAVTWGMPHDSTKAFNNITGRKVISYSRVAKSFNFVTKGCPTTGLDFTLLAEDINGFTTTVASVQGKRQPKCQLRYTKGGAAAFAKNSGMMVVAISRHTDELVLNCSVAIFPGVNRFDFNQKCFDQGWQSVKHKKPSYVSWRDQKSKPKEVKTNKIMGSLKSTIKHTVYGAVSTPRVEVQSGSKVTKHGDVITVPAGILTNQALFGIEMQGFNVPYDESELYEYGDERGQAAPNDHDASLCNSEMVGVDAVEQVLSNIAPSSSDVTESRTITAHATFPGPSKGHGCKAKDFEGKVGCDTQTSKKVSMFATRHRANQTTAKMPSQQAFAIFSRYLGESASRSHTKAGNKAKRLMDGFLKFIDEGKIEAITIEDLHVAAGDQFARIAEKASDQDIGLFGETYVSTDKIESFLKSQTKAAVGPDTWLKTKNGMLKPGQGISAQPKTINHIVGAYIRALEKKIKASFKSTVGFAYGVPKGGLDTFVRTRSKFGGKSVGLDISEQDTSKGLWTRLFFKGVAAMYGIPESIIDMLDLPNIDWILHGGWIQGQVKDKFQSGRSDTLLNNTVMALAIAGMSFNFTGLHFILAQGDDVYLRADRVTKSPHYYSKLKLDEAIPPAFVGFLVGQDCLGIDLPRLAVKLTSRQFNNDVDLKEYREAVHDWLSVHRGSVERECVSVMLSASHHKTTQGEMQILLEFIVGFANSTIKLADLSTYVQRTHVVAKVV